MIYTVDYFLAKFEAIPEGQWCQWWYDDDSGRHCVFGHLGITTHRLRTPQAEALRYLFFKSNFTPSDVNDGCGTPYKQPTPRQRILACLRDIKEKQRHP